MATCDQCGVKVSAGRNGTRQGNRTVCDRCRGFVRDGEGFAWRVEEVVGTLERPSQATRKKYTRSKRGKIHDHAATVPG